MITAIQAKVLSDMSGKEVDNFLTQVVEPAIKKAASAGLRQARIHIGSIDYYRRLDQEITPLQQSVLKKLHELQYAADIEKYGESYVPRGLADDDGHGPSHTNYGYQIGW